MNVQSTLTWFILNKKWLRGLCAGLLSRTSLEEGVVHCPLLHTTQGGNLLLDRQLREPKNL
jgi:hypothetical protein